MGTLSLVIRSLLILAVVSGGSVSANLVDQLNSLLNFNLIPAEQDGRGFIDTTYDSFSSALEITLNDDAKLETVYDNYQKSFEKTPGLKQLQSFHPERKNIFKDTLIDIVKHNEEARQGKILYEKGVNQFTDMTNEEVSQQYTGLVQLPESRSIITNAQTTSFRALPPLPYPWVEDHDNCDWRKRGDVSSVKHQDNCGSCTFFATAAQLESIYFLYHGGPLLDLSEQEILDCSIYMPGHYGCKGNDPDMALNYLHAYGLSSEIYYPYIKSQGAYCYFNLYNPRVKVANWAPVESYGDEDILKEAIRTHGPISVTVYTNNTNFMYYGHGIFEAPCEGPSDHMVLVVGYGTENNVDYWIVKNSWGENWGENGYIRIRRNHGNMCNIASRAFAIVAYA